MSDQYMSELHAWILLQHSQSNDRDSWVMLTRDGGIVPIDNEKILHTSRARVGLDITTPRELQVAEPFTLKCSDGKAFITNERVSSTPSSPSKLDDFQGLVSGAGESRLC